VKGLEYLVSFGMGAAISTVFLYWAGPRPATPTYAVLYVPYLKSPKFVFLDPNNAPYVYSKP